MVFLCLLFSAGFAQNTGGIAVACFEGQGAEASEGYISDGLMSTATGRFFPNAKPPFKLYPSPFDQELIIQNESEGPLDISVYNLKGKKLKEIAGFRGQLIIFDDNEKSGKSLPSGVYLVKVITTEAEYLQRVLKAK